MSTILCKANGTAYLLWSEADAETFSDGGRVVAPDELVDGVAVADWPDGVSPVGGTNRAPRFNENHGSDGKFSSADGASSSSGSADKKDEPEAPPADIDHFTHEENIAAVLAGRKVDVPGAEVPGLLGRMADREDHPDLVNVHISGTPLFAEGGLGIARIDMPQVEEKDRPEFLKSLGVGVQKVSVDPTLLQPSQKEISGSRAGKILEIMEKNGQSGSDKHRILVSKEDHVIDGHHTWAASVGYAFAHPGATIPAYKVDMGTRELLAAAHQWMTEHGGKPQAMDAKRFREMLDRLFGVRADAEQTCKRCGKRLGAVDYDWLVNPEQLTVEDMCCCPDMRFNEHHDDTGKFASGPGGDSTPELYKVQAIFGTEIAGNHSVMATDHVDGSIIGKAQAEIDGVETTVYFSLNEQIGDWTLMSKNEALGAVAEIKKWEERNGPEGIALATLDRLPSLTVKDNPNMAEYYGKTPSVGTEAIFGRKPVIMYADFGRWGTNKAHLVQQDLSTLTPAQESIPRAGLEAYIKEPPAERPHVIRMNDGRDVISAGHTRLGAAILRGETTYPVHRVTQAEFEARNRGKMQPVELLQSATTRPVRKMTPSELQNAVDEVVAFCHAEQVRFNPNHGPDGKFTEAVESAGKAAAYDQPSELLKIGAKVGLGPDDAKLFAAAVLKAASGLGWVAAQGGALTAAADYKAALASKIGKVLSKEWAAFEDPDALEQLVSGPIWAWKASPAVTEAVFTTDAVQMDFDLQHPYAPRTHDEAMALVLARLKERARRLLARVRTNR